MQDPVDVARSRTSSVLRGALSSFILRMLLLTPPQAKDSESSGVALARVERHCSGDMLGAQADAVCTVSIEAMLAHLRLESPCCCRQDVQNRMPGAITPTAL